MILDDVVDGRGKIEFASEFLPADIDLVKAYLKKDGVKNLTINSGFLKNKDLYRVLKKHADKGRKFKGGTVRHKWDDTFDIKF